MTAGAIVITSLDIKFGEDLVKGWETQRDRQIQIFFSFYMEFEPDEYFSSAQA